MKTRFFCWLAVVIALIIGLLRMLSMGMPLNTNILDLLPASSANQSLNQAVNLFSNAMGKQLVFLIGDSDKAVAEQAADQFYQEIMRSTLFEHIKYRISTNEQAAWGKFYFPYRLSLLTSEQKNLLKQHKINILQRSALADLYSPMGVAHSALLTHDPLFLFQHFLMSLPHPANHLSLYHEKMIAYADNHWYFMLTASLAESSFSISDQNKATAFIRAAKTKIRHQFPNTQILTTGMLFYAKAGTDAAQKDIHTIGIGSLLGIILLCLLAFRSLTPLIYTLLSALIGFLAALVITYYLFHTIYVFTLIFGASLIGISVDYAFFYYADRELGGKKWTTRQGLSNIFSGISLGWLNIVLAYAILAFMPFPGLKQLAVFAITGLTMAYATVICLFPLLLKAKPLLIPPSLLLRGINALLKAWDSMTKGRHGVILYSVLMLFAISGIFQLRINDDIHALESISPEIQHEEQQIKNIIGSQLGMDFYVVTGHSPEETLEHEHRLTEAITQAFPAITSPYLAISNYLPSLSEQRENFQLMRANYLTPSLITYLKNIGVEAWQARKILQELAATPFQLLTLEAWLASPVSENLRFLWLGKINNEFISIVLLSNQLNFSTLNSLTESLPFASYINKASEISTLFKIYREKIAVLLILIYIIFLILLLIYYKIKKAVYYFLPPFSAILFTLGALGWLGMPLTLFNLLALIFITGIAADYVLFFAETKSSYSATALATTLSAIATLLSFGLLSLSQTPVIHQFGITISIGIITAWLFSPLSMYAKKIDH